VTVVPQRVGPYAIEGTLGRGGMGVVYRARDPRTDQAVAVKVLAAGVDERQLARFRREARALTRLRHPGVVEVLDAGVDPAGAAWLAMSLVAGGTLADRLRDGGPLDVDDAVDLALQLASALAEIHAHGLVHRDLKPDNVLCAEGGRYVVADFGLVKELDVSESMRLSKSGLIQGTPGFWAPEQASGSAKQTTPATDVYLFGSTLYAALTGHPPFSGSGLVEILIATREVPPQPPRARRPEVPPWLEDLVLRCLAKAPAERYPDGAALLEALRAGPHGGSAPGPNRAVLVMLSAAALLLAGAVSLLTQGEDPAAPAPPVGSSGGAPGAAVSTSTRPGPAPSQPRSLDDATLSELRPLAEGGDLEAMYRLGLAYMDADEVPRDEAASARWMRRAAEGGHVRAMTNLGTLLAEGWGGPRDHQQAMAWFLRAAELGDHQAMYNYALGHGLGVVDEADPALAVRWFRASAELGNTDAMLNLAQCLATGQGVALDLAGAWRWLERAAQQGQPRAHLFMGLMHKRGAGTEPSEEAAAASFRRGAEQDEPRCMVRLALSLARGRGVPRDPEEAERWLVRAAQSEDPDEAEVQRLVSEARESLGELLSRSGPAADPPQSGDAVRHAERLRSEAEGGSPDAMNDLGTLLQAGEGVEADPAAAEAWFRRAADRGHAAAMVNLGSLLVGQGAGAEAEALGWFQRAADAGHPAGMRSLGAMYEQGRAVTRNMKLAAIWYRRAAEAGDLKARSALGLLYMRGDGVPKDPVEGVRWLHSAAEGDDPQALLNLGAAYVRGDGVPMDPARGAELYERAIAAGNARAMANLALLLQLGEGVRRDPARALTLYERSAALGDPTGMTGLGRAYAEGTITERDPARAARWFRAAAERGVPMAMFNLAVLLVEAEPPLRDEKEAERWFERASRTGRDPRIRELAAENLRRLRGGED
jgi:TPR repeat protein